jgi:hypothetical protein
MSILKTCGDDLRSLEDVRFLLQDTPIFSLGGSAVQEVDFRDNPQYEGKDIQTDPLTKRHIRI